VDATFEGDGVAKPRARARETSELRAQRTSPAMLIGRVRCESERGRLACLYADDGQSRSGGWDGARSGGHPPGETRVPPLVPLTSHIEPASRLVRSLRRLLVSSLARTLYCSPTQLLLVTMPMNALSRREEETLLKTAKTRALKECDPLVRGILDPTL
jgi:hypothetical protein